jgi:hypothetical protein
MNPGVIRRPSRAELKHDLTPTYRRSRSEDGLEKDGQVEHLGDNDDGVEEGGNVPAQGTSIREQLEGHGRLLDVIPVREARGLQH